MRVLVRRGEKVRIWETIEDPKVVCEVCGTEMEADRESGEVHCAVCEGSEQY
ncbi:hypothetical protein [Geobacter sp. DSM 9736]|uniref:hypothetical protein n=1 Tax=Geobacter sp. DSM 9736 TaxID=1277350 RepID=UPI000B620A36|nr:hypothetical protein [Geobacter sp. DSM 9736]SNB45871.1 hypothetical protein SAMN06269301_1301 [Geobacter sp. DSM 9736]